MIDLIASAATAACTGAVLASFATTAAIRSASDQSAWRGRSRCDGCRAPLGWSATIPIFAYAALRGRCRSCRGRIDPAHLLGELAGAMGGVLVLQIASSPRAAVVAALGLTLLALAAFDARTLRIPDRFSLLVAVLAVVLAAMSGLEALVVGLASGALAFGALAMVRVLSRTSDGDYGLGLGDAKLVGALAIWLGTQTPLAVGVASLLGLAFSTWRRPAGGRFAFGPMIAAAGWLVGVAGEVGWPST